eukprot:4919575-Ditylum_brightwellii.AAC.1
MPMPSATPTPMQTQVFPTPGTTFVTFQTGIPIMIPVQAGISNGEKSKNDGNPAIHKIMTSYPQHRGIHSLMAMLPPENKELCLIDGSSNNGLTVSRMHLYEIA